MQSTAAVNFTSELTTITPELARQWLANAAPNRPLNDDRILMFAEEIERGHWRRNGETIKFDDCGRLIDGQHRLHAVLLTGKTIEAIVVHGVSSTDGSMMTIDTGMKRTNSHVLSLIGEKNTAALAAALNWKYRYDNGKTGYHRGMLSAGELQRTLVANPAIRDSVTCTGNYRTKLLPPGISAWLHFEFSQKDLPLANEFMQGMCDGFDPHIYQNFFRLRERLTRERLSKHSVSPHEKAAYCVKSWNSTRNGTLIQQLKFLCARRVIMDQKTVEIPGETFPTIL